MQPNTNKKIFIGIVLLAVLLIGAGVFYFIKENPSFFTRYFSSLGKRSVPPGTVVVNLNQVKDDLAAFKYNILMPKSKVSQDYYDTFNITYNELVLLDSTNRDELYPAVAKIRERIAARNNNDLASLITQVQKIQKTERSREAVVSVYLNTLSSLNEKTTDEKIRSLTASYVVAGKKLNNDFISYSAHIDAIIAGGVSTSTPAESETILKNLTASANNFRVASQELIAFFAEILKNDASVSSSPTTKK